jgi:hypothetical protein
MSNETYIKTPRHNLTALRELIKADASTTRATRNEARSLTREAKADMLRAAKYDEDGRRVRLLAYGYLRGRSIEQMESLSSDVNNLPSFERILAVAKPHFSEEVESFETFSARIKADLQTWKAKLLLESTLKATRKALAVSATSTASVGV